MTLKKVTRKITIRKVGRSLYALIPSEIANELSIKERDEAIIMIDVASRTVAFSFKSEN